MDNKIGNLFVIKINFIGVHWDARQILYTPNTVIEYVEENVNSNQVESFELTLDSDEEVSLKKQKVTKTLKTTKNTSSNSNWLLSPDSSEEDVSKTIKKVVTLPKVEKALPKIIKKVVKKVVKKGLPKVEKSSWSLSIDSD